MPQDKWTNATGTFALSDEAPPLAAANEAEPAACVFCHQPVTHDDWSAGGVSAHYEPCDAADYPKPAITDYTAVGVVEGWLDSESEEEVIASWQHLINSGLAWRLQGWFGRTAQALINTGVCTGATP